MKRMKRIINLFALIFLLGLIVFYKYKLGYLELFETYVISRRGWADIYTYLYIICGIFEMIYCLVVLCDNTRKKIPSALITVIGVAYSIGSLFIGYRRVVEPCTDVNIPTIIAFRMNLIFNAIGIIFTSVILLQYIYKKNKHNFFWKYNIFLFPIIAWVSNINWFNDLTGPEYWDNLLSNIGIGTALIMAIMFLFAFLLFNRYGSNKKEPIIL